MKKWERLMNRTRKGEKSWNKNQVNYCQFFHLLKENNSKILTIMSLYKEIHSKLVKWFLVNQVRAVIHKALVIIPVHSAIILLLIWTYPNYFKITTQKNLFRIKSKTTWKIFLKKDKKRPINLWKTQKKLNWMDIFIILGRLRKKVNIKKNNL